MLFVIDSGPSFPSIYLSGAHSIIYSFNKYLLSVYPRPGTVPMLEMQREQEKTEALPTWNLQSSGGDSQQIHRQIDPP